MEARCSRCAFPIHVDAPGEATKCPACGFRGIAEYDDTKSWLLGLLGALSVIGIARAMKEGKRQ